MLTNMTGKIRRLRGSAWAWRSALLLVWLMSLPIVYLWLFQTYDGTPGAPDSGGEWAMMVAIALAVWTAAFIAGALLVRRAFRAFEGWIARIVVGRSG